MKDGEMKVTYTGGLEMFDGRTQTMDMTDKKRPLTTYVGDFPKEFRPPHIYKEDVDKSTDEEILMRYYGRLK